MSILNGKVAVVTGGNSGIGYATAKNFADNGATVIITGRSADRVQKAAVELGVRGLVADVADLAATDNLVDQVKKDYGTVDILLVNAGIFAPEPVGQISEEIFDNQMGIVFKGAVFTI